MNYPENIKFTEIHPLTDHNRGFTYIYVPSDGLFCYGGSYSPEKSSEGKRVGVEHSDLERWLDNSSEIRESNIDIHNSLKGYIYPNEEEGIIIFFSTLFWEETEVKKTMEEIIPQLKERFKTAGVVYLGGKYYSDKQKRQEALRKAEGRLDHGNFYYDPKAAQQKLWKNYLRRHKGNKSDMDDSW